MSHFEIPPIAEDSDQKVDEKLIECLIRSEPKSFFLFAGAGSGKTRSLVNALSGVIRQSGKRMLLRGQQVAVITYTNAACDEIVRRLDFNPLVTVSTIHSFVWELIKGFDSDIRSWLTENVKASTSELFDLERKGRPGTQASRERLRSIEAGLARLEALPTIKRFIYSPTGENRTRDSLNHSEVIKVGGSFLMAKPLMQQLLVRKFPILLIDESQDTNKLLMEAFMTVQAKHAETFALGLFGDTMQRIYADGKIGLEANLPPTWEQPSKLMNHRCPRRIVTLVNKIRSSVDDHKQRWREDAKEGVARLFIAANTVDDKQALETLVRLKMAELASDQNWLEEKQVKALTLEHHMAARRLNFLHMFTPLDGISEYSTGLRDGTLPLIRFFSELVLPLVRVSKESNKFAIAAHVRKHSPLLDQSALQAVGTDQTSQIRAAKAAVENLMELFLCGRQPSFLDVLGSIAKTQLFEIPSALFPFIPADGLLGKEVEKGSQDSEHTEGNSSERIDAVRDFLATPFEQIDRYSAYIKGETVFATHQGVKGLEFPRVLVLIDDEEARGFLFSYEKLLGVKEKTDSDLKNEKEGKETGLDRTRRLFYVTCSRTRESLAILAYTANQAKVREYALVKGWFDESEIILLN